MQCLTDYRHTTPDDYYDMLCSLAADEPHELAYLGFERLPEINDQGGVTWHILDHDFAACAFEGITYGPSRGEASTTGDPCPF